MKKQIVNVLEFDTLQEGWQGINEYLFRENQEISDRQGGLYGPEMISFDNYVVMKRAWVDPDFDFGLKLGYNIKKWSSLVNNYVDLRYLDMMKAEINRREGKKARSYNHTYHFDNSHGSGKDCLVALTFTKRAQYKIPIVIFSIRTSEVTKRLLWDFLLVQRIIEYIYGNNDAEVHFHAPSFYITAESFVMYNNIKKIKKIVNPKGDLSKFQTKVFKIFKEYMNHPNPEEVIYRVHRRSIMQIQKDEDGIPISGVVSLKAKDCQLREKRKTYPKNVISKTERRRFDKENR